MDDGREVERTTTEVIEEVKPTLPPKIPIAVGPCFLYRKPIFTEAGCSDQFCKVYNYCCADNQLNVEKTKGEWRDCFLSLYNDSTLVFHDGTDDKAPAVMSLKMIERYRELSFGRDIVNVPGQNDVPETVTKKWDAVLAIPDMPNCNSSINWVDFSSEDTLKKWLVAICRTLPLKTINPQRFYPSLRYREAYLQQNPLNDELTAQIKMFFPRRETCLGTNYYSSLTGYRSNNERTYTEMEESTRQLCCEQSPSGP